jgi:group I intron endonuclease
MASLRPKFILVILEYCGVGCEAGLRPTPPTKDVISREQYYLDLLNPDYNILKIARSYLGYKHSEETRAKMSGKNNPFFGKTRSEETRTKMSVAKKGKNHPMFGKKNTGSQPHTIKIKVTDIELNTNIIYASMHEAARTLNISQAIISGYFRNKQKKPYKGRYIFKKID